MRSRRGTQVLGLAVATVCVALGGSATGAASGPFEPNDTQPSATGPLLGGSTYSAAIENRANPSAGLAADVDWYVFYTSGAVSFDVAYTNTQQAGNCFGPQARLYDEAGSLLGSAHPARAATQHITYNAPGQQTYYLRVDSYPVVSCDPPDLTYSFDITPPGALRIPPGQQPVVPPKRNPSIRVRKATLGLWLRLRGSRAQGTDAKRIVVTAWRTSKRKRVSFRFRARASGPQRWTAARRLPRKLRGTRTLRYRVRYVGSSGFTPKSLPAKSVRARR